MTPDREAARVEATKFNYFACDFDNNIEFFTTEDAARKYAEDALSEAQSDLSDGWHENTTDICYGRVIASVEVTKRIERSDVELNTDGVDEQGNHWDPDWTHMLWHELTSTGYDAGASQARVEALVEIVRGLIQIYTDLEKDVETDAAIRGVEYHHWPMADEMLDKAKAALR